MYSVSLWRNVSLLVVACKAKRRWTLSSSPRVLRMARAVSCGALLMRGVAHDLLVG